LLIISFFIHRAFLSPRTIYSLGRCCCVLLIPLFLLRIIFLIQRLWKISDGGVKRIFLNLFVYIYDLIGHIEVHIWVLTGALCNHEIVIVCFLLTHFVLAHALHIVI
jgi:hypothetical protein